MKATYLAIILAKDIPNMGLIWNLSWKKAGN